MKITYCNPMDLDYGFCPIPNFVTCGKHRATADPAIVRFRDDYYLFSTNQWGYWWSTDLSEWTFVPRLFLKPDANVFDELCAPAIWVMDDALYVVGSTYTKEFSIWRSRNPRIDDWEVACESFEGEAWDPAFLLDDDGRLYLYHGSGNDKPLYGREIDPKTLQPLGENIPLVHLDPENHGWERFGEANDNTFLHPFMEGAWSTKHEGRYYLQYGAPATEFSGYADGVYVADAPLGPFVYQTHNPVSYVPGGFARGAGHGATFTDHMDRYWHTSTIVIGVKNNFERRNGLWPCGFDAEGTMWCDTAYSDYPRVLPATGHGELAGWMLLNYAKPVRASSTLGGFSANFAVDENIKTYWSAETGGPDEWFESDLGVPSTVHAIQVNFADQDAELMGKVPGISQAYRVMGSLDGQTWFLIAESEGRDAPHAYHELPEPVRARYVRLEGIRAATGKVALSGLRVFGLGDGLPPKQPDQLVVLRGASEPRNAWLKWAGQGDATGYVIRSGVAPEKLYHSMTVYTATEAWWRAMTRDETYWFTLEAFNENGISPQTTPVESPVP